MGDEHIILRELLSGNWIRLSTGDQAYKASHTTRQIHLDHKIDIATLLQPDVCLDVRSKLVYLGSTLCKSGSTREVTSRLPLLAAQPIKKP